MVSVREQVIDYIKIKYRTSGEYKCSVSEIRKALTAKPSFSSTPSSISVAVSALKSEGTLTALDEKDPERKGKGGVPSYLITLTEILEEITSPKIEKEKMTKVPAQTTPVTVAANPFDKVNERLDIIVTQLRGLATGYSDLVKRTSNPSGTDPQLIEQMSAAAKAINSLGGRQNETLDIIKVIQDEVRHRTDLELKRSPLTVAVADEINARLSDLSRDDSFIYRVREELDEQGGKTDKHIKEQYNRVDNKLQILFEAWKKDQETFVEGQQHIARLVANISVPSSVANPNDYREGIKEGIKLAVEMGLRPQQG